MSWYYYTGKMIRPIMVSKDTSKAVKPNTKVEIFEIVGDTQFLIDNVILRRTSNPNIKIKKAIQKPKKEEKSLRDVLKVSKFAASFAEKGKTSSANIAPLSKKPEFTLGEIGLSEGSYENNEQTIEENVEEETKDESSKRKRNKKGQK